MSFRDCIEGNTLLTKAQRRKILNNYEAIKGEYLKHSLDVDAASIAAEKIAGQLGDELAKKKLNTIKDLLQWKGELLPKLEANAALYANKKNKAKFLKGFLFGNERTHTNRVELEDTLTKQIATEREFTTMLHDVVEKFRSKFAGLTQDVAGMRRVARAAMGATGDAEADAMAKPIRQVFDLMHKRYKNAGGILGYIDNYWPQAHNADLIGRAGFDQWKLDIRDEIDLDKMIDFETGLRMTEEKLNELLPDIYESIRTNGLSELAERVKSGKTTPGKRAASMAQRRAYSRFFVFKDPDAFLRYNAKYGMGDEGLFDMMLGHISSMSRDISIMEALGPKPELQIQRMKLWAEAGGATESAQNVTQGMYDILAGRTSFNGQLPSWYKFVQGVQDWQRSSLLGGAPVAAMTDSFYSAATAKMNGIPAAKVMGQWASLLNPANAADRRVAKRIGFISSVASGSSLASARMFENNFGGSRGVIGWLAGFTNRASGLATMTDAAKAALPLSTMGHLAELKASKVKWDNIEPEMKEAFARWGMGQDDFNKMMSVNPHIADETGADFIRPEDLAAAGHIETARKYGNWLADMSQSASNEPRLLTRYITTGAFKKGTGMRAVVSSAMMFKSFGVTVMLNHTIPSLRRFAVSGNPTEFVGGLLIGTTLLGGMAIQARDLLYGKTPRDMTNPKFWGAAMMQGGGFGIFGDFLFSDYSRFGNSLATTLGGPIVGSTNDVMRVFKGNFDRALDEGQESKFFGDLYQFGERNIPGVKLWYTRLLMERLFLDHAERMIDPNFDKRMRRIESMMRKDKGQQFWWKPGKVQPQGF